MPYTKYMEKYPKKFRGTGGIRPLLAAFKNLFKTTSTSSMQVVGHALTQIPHPTHLSNLSPGRPR